MQISEILDAFKYNDGSYKRENIDAAIQQQDAITPHLIEILTNLRDSPTPYLEEEDRFDHIYAVMLLGHFRAAEAHNVIVDVFSLPDNIPSDLFDDLITEDLPAVLLRTCGNSLDRIRELVLNQDAYEFCRSAAATAMVYAVLSGIATRDEILEFFGTLFTGQEADDDSAFWDGLAYSVYQLYPEELMDIIDKAYRDGLISSMMIDFEEFERAIAVGKARTLERTREDMRRRLKRNIHDAMSWWACFELPSPPVDSSFSPHSVGQKTRSPAKPTAKIGRNAPCPCGSGLKYKKCCLNKSS